MDTHGLWTIIGYGLSRILDYQSSIMDSGLSWYYGGFWTIMVYHGLLWTMDYHGLFWIIIDYCGLSKFSWSIMDDGLLWTIVDYRGLLRMIVNYADYRELWIIMVHMIFIENCLPISELYLEAIF